MFARVIRDISMAKSRSFSCNILSDGTNPPDMLKVFNLSYTLICCVRYTGIRKQRRLAEDIRGTQSRVSFILISHAVAHHRFAFAHAQ